MTLESFAQHHRLKIRQDECGDPVSPGRRGKSQLYFADSDGLCLVVLDGPPANRGRWLALGGKLWMGDISHHPTTGRRVQDVKVTNIPLDNAKLAINLARVKPKQQRSEARLAAATERLAKWRQQRSAESFRPRRTTPLQSVESIRNPNPAPRATPPPPIEKMPVLTLSPASGKSHAAILAKYLPQIGVTPLCP